MMCDVVSEVTGISKFRTNLFCQVSSSVAVAVSRFVCERIILIIYFENNGFITQVSRVKKPQCFQTVIYLSFSDPWLIVSNALCKSNNLQMLCKSV